MYGGGEVKKYKPQGQSKFLLGVRTLLRGGGKKENVKFVKKNRN